MAIGHDLAEYVYSITNTCSITNTLATPPLTYTNDMEALARKELEQKNAELQEANDRARKVRNFQYAMRG